MFLTPADLQRLTGRRQRAAQRRYLDRQRIPYRTDADGAPVVLASAIGENTQPAPARPRFDAVRPAR
jgi:hypothetical protein